MTNERDGDFERGRVDYSLPRERSQSDEIRSDYNPESDPNRYRGHGLCCTREGFQFDNDLAGIFGLGVTRVRGGLD